ncbi:MAG: thioredoxin-dependent thiol peroxidase [Bacteroidetes bacterium]|nr:thioredoxin-dependent thiol peroxidase [Bacteroidota bacterium]MDA0942728.1 thioredoxin-dependent thiol peroxidase [Bacteroidota bacterium]MDA1111382.1 thioredoxin-dependent thiol peroxidase [Bacteroidota bacterium]
MSIQIGQAAPDFSANNQNGKALTLGDFKGKKLVLYFYPKDDTPGCTAEACSLRDHYQTFLGQGYAILGVSPDNEAKHQKFIAKYELPFDLLADTDHAVAEAYGVWVEKSMYGRQYMGIARTTFVIDENGIMADIIQKVNTKEHGPQLLGS